jgi:DNA-binding phage protein
MPRPRKSKPLSPDHAAFGQAIELAIAETPPMTQESVAARSGLSVEQVGRLIRGQGNPTFTTMLRLCRGLGVSLGELMIKAEALKRRGQ